MAITSRDDILWYWDAEDGLQPLVGGEPTFARASSAVFTSDGKLRSGGDNFERVEMSRIAAGDPERPALRLAMAGTNELLDSEDFSSANWASNVGTPVVTTDVDVARDGEITADKLEDDDTGTAEAVGQGITVPDDSNPRCFSVHIKKTSGATVFPRIAMFHIGGTASSGAVGIDTNTGEVTLGTTGDAGGALDRGDYWRVWAVVSNNSTGNTTLVCRINPAATTDGGAGLDATLTGSIVAWGAQLEERAFPTAYVATTGSTATRAAESMSWNGAPDPQAMVGYLDVVLVNPVVGAGERYFHLGDPASAGSDPRLWLGIAAGGSIFTGHDNGTAQSTATVSLTNFAPGDRVQVVSVLQADGSVRTVVSHDGAAVDATTGVVPSGGIVSPWSDSVLSLNSVGVGLVNAARYRRLALVKPDNLDAALDGTEDQELHDEMAGLVYTPLGTVRSAA